MSCVIPQGEAPCKLVPGLPWTWPHVPFLFAGFALYPFFIMNLSHDHMLSPVNPPNESLNRGWSWGP